VLGPTTGKESFTSIANPKTTACPEGIVALKDVGANILICDKWNSKGGRETAISPEVTQVGVDIDMIIGEHTTEEQLLKAGAETAAFLKAHCGATDVKAYMLSKETPTFMLGGESTIKLPEVVIGGAKGAADAGPAWIAASEIHDKMSVDGMTATLIEGIVAAAAAAKDEDALRHALQRLLKPKLGCMVNHAYAMGHHTVLEEIGPPRQDCRQ
jgi:hypothetical protein